MKRLRHHIQFFFYLCFWIISPSTQAWCQDDPGIFDNEMHLLEIESRMLNFYQELKEIAVNVGQYTPDELIKADKKVSTIDAKWNTYYQSKQIEIAEDDSLLQIVANYQLAKQSLLDSIAIQKHFFDAQKSFSNAETFLKTQDSIYAQLYKTAFELSLVQTLTTELEKVKGKEQLLFAEIQNQYDTAKGVSQEFESFLPRFQPIEEKYIELKNTSEKIQALKYKPWLERIKDYLYSLAAVAIILLFINMLQAKIKAFKQARENAKKLREMMDKNNNDYPTI
ncbi:hypothetical protein [Bacteroides mediterraneensis]|uniref:Uncharacterized protein n=1 Tax=Bacteroides mediterraneensis TaxID=1841856 RepID=A0ABS2EW15_9BACE|nr:hypothetical protein [Bacteroides mediterraneensis]MBM6758870.1 hypothetical protein [Bacteroides mediterraneensis]MBM6782037.1 hypothetical protein [Bacteroides mediterraneensis]